MVFSQGFTGKGTGIVLPEGTGRAQEGLSQMILDAEKLRYETFQKNKAEFLKNANIDPLFVLSNAARETQMKEINNFNKVWGKRAQETNYNLSQEDLLNMQTHKNIIIANQQKQVADYERFKQHTAMVAQNPNRYSSEQLSKWQEEYMDSGKYDYTMPPLKPIPPGTYIKELASKLKGGVPKEVIEGSQKAIRYPSFANEEEAGNFVMETLLKNDQLMLGGLEEWETLPQATKEQFFAMADENKDKKISSAEQNNAIMMWMKKRYTPDAMRYTDVGWKSIPRGKTTTKKETGYDVLKDQTFEAVKFNSFLNFSPSETSAKTQPIQNYIDLETGKEETLNKAATFKVVGYSPDKDLIVVNLTSEVPSTGKTDVYLPANKQIALKGSLYDDFLRNKFGIDRASLMKQYGSQPATPTGPVTMPITGGEESVKPKKKLY